MEWIKNILEKHIDEDGKLDLDGAIKDINKKCRVTIDVTPYTIQRQVCPIEY